MTYDELEIRARKMFGRYWISRLAETMKVHVSTPYRWGHKDPAKRKPVPFYVDIWFDAVEKEKRMASIVRKLVK